MKLETSISDMAPAEFAQAFAAPGFVSECLTEVVGKALGVENPLGRPGEFHVQAPGKILTVEADRWGVEFRITGVSRNGRKAAQFHKALQDLQALAIKQIQQLRMRTAARTQVFCVLVLDGEVETEPGSGRYSTILETQPVWVTSEGVFTDESLIDAVSPGAGTSDPHFSNAGRTAPFESADGGSTPPTE